jgi:hypothetical protein
MLKILYFVRKIGVDKSEDEPEEVWMRAMQS